MLTSNTSIILPKKGKWCSYGNVSGQNLYEVDRFSNMYAKRALEKFAMFFKREGGYDFVQYCISDRDNYKGYLFLHHCNDKDIVGGCCFRWREYTNYKHMWALQWIWLHPYYRNKHILTEAWPYFRKIHGDFYPEPPYSKPMKSFLEKNEHHTFDKSLVAEEKPLPEKPLGA